MWREICDQTALRIETLTEQVRPALDALESDEADPERVQRLYDVDHGISRMRRTARDLRILAGRCPDEIGRSPTSLLDVVRVATSMIEHYGRVQAEGIADRVVLGHAADDLAALLAALLDNATRYSPVPACVGTHVFGDGSLLVRIEDGGPGMDPASLEKLNRTLAGPVRPVGAATVRRTGFAVVHRLARKHGMELALVNRGAARAVRGRCNTGDQSGTVAMVTVPPELLTVLDRPTGGAPPHVREGC
ncbi:ATP-binding protein [Actinomadura sp. CNU-125]|uniref:ATP-binding protein n=1 Tax=Actinomadura sp. CNU-125 TaxID=1904961 RepID=UPI0021CCA3FA|nr:ATP-binding protein [Actinomadura sp. CNU-125]